MSEHEVEDGLKVCARCDELRPADGFRVYRKPEGDYVSKICRRCLLASTKEGREKVVARRGFRTKRPKRLTEGGMTGAERRAYWATFKRRAGCTDCGTHDWRVLEFDHLPGFEKLFTIGEAVKLTGFYTDEQIAAEVTKCEVVCNSCHLSRTMMRRSA